MKVGDWVEWSLDEMTFIQGVVQGKNQMTGRWIVVEVNAIHRFWGHSGELLGTQHEKSEFEVHPYKPRSFQKNRYQQYLDAKNI